MGDINQDDIDKLLQDTLDEEGSEEKPIAPPEVAESGAASQDDIDALFATVVGDPPPAAESSPSAAPIPEEDIQAGETVGMVGQDDIDALFASLDAPQEGAPPATAATGEEGAPSQPPAEQPAEETASDAEADGNGAPEETVPPEQSPAPAEASAAAETAPDAELDALLDSLGEDAPPGPGTGIQPDGDMSSIPMDADMEELLRQVTEASPPPPVRIETSSPPVAAEPSLSPSPPPPPEVAPPPVSPPPPAPPALASAPSGAGERREFSVLYGAGEVASVAGQISSLLSTMSEKANSYMQAWIAADSEAKELRARALAEERRRSGLESERTALQKELETIRRRLGELEGEKIGLEEAGRSREAALQSKNREMESQTTLLRSECDALKAELSRTRNQATGVDIESRRVRFEADRLKNEVESERMERLRIQRALENREKELQALQAQTAGQASSLFVDELHRLVRRLETELEARSSGAHEALKQLDRLDAPEGMVPVVANLRAAILQAMGADDDGEDALKSLGREASGVRGPSALAPGKPEVLSFETALATYNIAAAIEAASALLREAKATPGLLMRKIYQCPALRRPETIDRLPDLARLLDGLRTVQESFDRSRGSESGESELFHVQMFDFLHNLVRLKIITRMSGDMWRIFLDLRGRFSFVTSDRQWAEYRDGVLGGRETKA